MGFHHIGNSSISHSVFSLEIRTAQVIPKSALS